MAIVYSYIRFSTKKQLEGDSLRRQLELGDAFIAKHGHTPGTLTLHDIGVSAFRGKNKETGALASFLEAIKNGRVEPGSMLLVENLDRLSRQGVRHAFNLFQDILEAGVTIAVLKPYEIVYNKDDLDDFITLLIPLVAFHLAYLESKNKSDRLSEVWRQKRKKAQPGERMDGSHPSWVDWDEVNQVFHLNDGANAIRFIFQSTADGKGQRAVVAELVKLYRPIGRSGRWNGSFVQKVLGDRTVLGERQPHTFNKEGERVPIGEVIQGYYPPAIDEPLWFRAQAAKANNRKAKGPNKEFVNLFVGLLRNAHDGYPMHIQTTRLPIQNSETHVQRRLVSYGHICQYPNADSVTVDYSAFENVVLTYLSEIQPEDLENRTVISTVRTREQEREGILRRLGELKEALTEPDAGSVKTLVASVQSLEGRLALIDEEITRLQAEIHADQPLNRSQDILKVLHAAPEDTRHQLRLRLRSHIAELVEKIIIKPEKHFGRVYTLAVIVFRSGYRKQIEFGPGFTGGSTAPLDDGYLTVDLEDMAGCRSRQVFTETAKMLTAPSETIVPNEIPDSIGGAAEVWYATIQATMKPETFRIIPPKVNRFVEYVGRDVPCSALCSQHWRNWIRHLKHEVEDSKIASNTAHVTVNRIKEFLRWLIDRGKVDAWDGLEVSAAKVLA